MLAYSTKKKGVKHIFTSCLDKEWGCLERKLDVHVLIPPQVVFEKPLPQLQYSPSFVNPIRYSKLITLSSRF